MRFAVAFPWCSAFFLPTFSGSVPETFPFGNNSTEMIAGFSRSLMGFPWHESDKKEEKGRRIPRVIPLTGVSPLFLQHRKSTWLLKMSAGRQEEPFTMQFVGNAVMGAKKRSKQMNNLLINSNYEKFDLPIDFLASEVLKPLRLPSISRTGPFNVGISKNMKIFVSIYSDQSLWIGFLKNQCGEKNGASLKQR